MSVNICQQLASVSEMKTLPHSPAWNTHSLNDTDHNLGHEDEEERHKVEGAVSPAQRKPFVIHCC